MGAVPESAIIQLAVLSNILGLLCVERYRPPLAPGGRGPELCGN